MIREVKNWTWRKKLLIGILVAVGAGCILFLVGAIPVPRYQSEGEVGLCHDCNDEICVNYSCPPGWVWEWLKPVVKIF
jgi:hypothetical protein